MSAQDRITKLGIECSEKRAATLARAMSVSDSDFKKIATAVRVHINSETIVLPAHRFEGLSRGTGWARKGRGASAEWGERTDSGYRVGPGEWVVGGSDGFNRKGQDAWVVETLLVDGTAWTIAS